MSPPIARLRRPARVVVVGVSGSGKTTLARELAQALAVPHVELDEFWHLEGWSNPSREEFRLIVERLAAQREWAFDGNYSVAQDLTLARATSVVWIQLPRWLGTLRAVRRTVRRIVTREALWNGNRERWRTVLADWHPIRWGWSTYPVKVQRYNALFESPPHGDCQLIRLSTPGAVRQWLDLQRAGSGVEPPTAG